MHEIYEVDYYLREPAKREEFHTKRYPMHARRIALNRRDGLFSTARLSYFRYARIFFKSSSGVLMGDIP